MLSKTYGERLTAMVRDYAYAYVYVKCTRLTPVANMTCTAVGYVKRCCFCAPAKNVAFVFLAKFTIAAVISSF